MRRDLDLRTWLFAFFLHSALAVSAFSQVGSGEITVTATQGVEWDQTRQVYIARGDAAIKQGNISVFADTLVAYYRDQVAGNPTTGAGSIYWVEATGKVTALLEDDKLKSEKLVYDLDSGQVEATGGQPTFETAEGLVAQAEQRLLYDPKNLKAYAVGDVLVIDGEARIKADQMILDFFPSPQNSQPSEIRLVTATGRVTVVQDDGTAEADTLLYDPNGQLAELIGNVRLLQPNGSIATGQVGKFDFVSGLGQIFATDPNLPQQPGQNQRVTVIIK